MSDGKPEQQFQPTVIKQKICSDKTLHALQELLEAVVDSGTARALKNSNYSIAGKTGTAQIADDTRKYADKVYQSSFVGYFPADKPTLLMHRRSECSIERNLLRGSSRRSCIQRTRR
jgi:cell division protein FtsI (penicillin-binding protein 3)